MTMQIRRLIMRNSLINISLSPHKAHSTTVENIRQITPIAQNKPKVKSPQNGLSPCLTSTYAQMDNWLNAKNKPNQTQSKPNPNPKQTQSSPQVKIVLQQKFRERKLLKVKDAKCRIHPYSRKFFGG
jgi:hypothetical protein